MQAEISTALYRQKLSKRAPSRGTEPRGRGCKAHSIFLNQALLIPAKLCSIRVIVLNFLHAELAPLCMQYP